MPTALEVLADVIRRGLPAGTPELRRQMEAAVEERYGKLTAKRAQFRDAYALAREEAEGGVPWAGFIRSDVIRWRQRILGIGCEGVLGRLAGVGPLRP